MEEIFLYKIVNNNILVKQYKKGKIMEFFFVVKKKKNWYEICKVIEIIDFNSKKRPFNWCPKTIKSYWKRENFEFIQF